MLLAERTTINLFAKCANVPRFVNTCRIGWPVCQMSGCQSSTGLESDKPSSFAKLMFCVTFFAKIGWIYNRVGQTIRIVFEFTNDELFRKTIHQL